VIDAFVVRVESVVCGGGGEIPDLDSAVKARGGKCVGVFGVDGKGHNVMGMTLEHSKTLPVLIPVPQLDGHIIGTGEDKRLCGMHSDTSNVTRVSTKLVRMCTLDALRN